MQKQFQKHHQSKIRWRKLSIAVVLLVAATFGDFLSTPAAALPACDDVQFIFARGSGEKLGDVSYQAWQSSIAAILASTSLQASFYELGSKSVAGYQYPAVSVSDDFWGYVNLLSAFFTGGDAFEFGKSVEQGSEELQNYLAQVSSACPGTKFILGGYSQGAMVLSKTLPQLDASKILYVATFGDPKIYLPEGSNELLDYFKTPDACKGNNLSPYRAYVPDCRAFKGVLGAVRPYQPAGFAGKLGTWCNKSDIMCSSGSNLDDHTAYVSDNLYGDAADYINRRLIKAFPAKTSAKSSKRNLHDLVFLFDTTGSMSYMIERYQAEARKLAEQIYAQHGRVALYEYKDLQDDVPVRQLCDFSCSQDELYQKIAELSTYGGGDDSESLLSAALSAMNELDWRFGATKSLFVLTDAGYLSPDRDKTTEAEVVQKSLEIDPVNFYVMTNSYTSRYYQDLAAQTNGKVFDIYDDLELSSEMIFERPVAKLSTLNYTGKIGDTLTFDASESYSLNDVELRFDWDLDGDGKYELKNAGPVVAHRYDTEFSDFVMVKVLEGNKTSTMSAQVRITPQPEVAELAELKNLTTTQPASEQLRISFETNADTVLVFGNGNPLGFIGVKEQNGDFTISEVDQDLELVLVPYLDQQRGLTKTLNISTAGEDLEIAETSGAPETKPPVSDSDGPDSSDPTTNLPLPGHSKAPSFTSAPSQQSTLPNISNDTNVVDNVPSFTIPTAPDTGVKSY